MLASDFAERFREEHRQLRDILLALRDALENGDTDLVQEEIGELAAMAGPHFHYEGEALYPALAELYGDEYVNRLLTEHEATLAAARNLAELAEAAEFTPEEFERALDLVGEMLPHVSERDGLAVMVEILPPEQVGAIVQAREQAKQKRISIHEAARHGAAKGKARRGTQKPQTRRRAPAQSKPLARGRVKTAAKKRAR
jgi:Hemerythrin HHE cation binding domain